LFKNCGSSYGKRLRDKLWFKSSVSSKKGKSKGKVVPVLN